MWKIGDQAVRVKTRREDYSAKYLANMAPLGDIISLNEVVTVIDTVVVNGHLGLVFAEKRSGHTTGGYLADQFCKVQKSTFDFKQWLTQPVPKELLEERYNV